MLRDGHGARAIHSRTFHPIARHMPILGAGTVDAVDKSIGFEVWVPMLSHPVSLVLEHAERVRRGYKLLVLPPFIKREFVRQAGSFGEPVL